MAPIPAGTDVDPDVAVVRLLCADEDPTNQLLPDPKYQSLLDLEGGNVKRAAAQALDIIASSETLVAKKIRTQDLSTDGPAIAAELRKHAAALREQADIEADDDGYLEVIDMGDLTTPEHTAGY